MRTLFLSAAIGLLAGVICFFLSVAFLCFVLLIVGAVVHGRPDMTLAFKAAAPVAVLAAVSGFVVTLVRSLGHKPRNTYHGDTETRRHGAKPSLHSSRRQTLWRHKH